MGRTSSGVRGSKSPAFIKGIPGLPWTEGISATGFDFAREAPTGGLIARMNERALNTAISSLDANIKDAQMRDEMKSLIQKMHAEMGGLPRDYEIKMVGKSEMQRLGGTGYALGFMSGNVIGLNRSVFGKSYKSAESVVNNLVANGRALETKQPVLNTLAHEIGHGYYKLLSQIGKIKVQQVYTHFSAANPKGWRAYSSRSAEEFYADAVAKATLGASDDFTRILGSIR